MRSVVFEDAGRVSVAEVPDAVLEEPGDAVVRVTLGAICGSDLHFLHGKAPVAPGESLGHEAVGVVQAVGEGVTRFRVGDRVVAAFTIACGSCWFCRHGQTQLCEQHRTLGAGAFGGGLAGAQADLVRIPVADVNLLAIPDGVDDEHALFVGDILTSGVYAAALGSVDIDDVVAVVGAGPVGYFCAQAARALGAARVFALDVDAERLARAEAAGTEPLDVTRRHPATALADATGGRGADVVIDAVGSVAAFESAMDVVRRGGRVVILGVYASEVAEVQLGVYWARAIQLRFAGITPVHTWWERAMAAIVEGTIDPLPIISHRLPLSDAAHGYALFDGREATKVLLIP